MKKYLFAAIIALVEGEFSFETCFTCADKSSFKFCSNDGHVANAWTGACCSEGETSPECTPDDKNICSETFSNSQHLFYSHCALNNHTMCSDGTSTAFDAISTPRSFEFSGLKRSVDALGNPLQQDACTYEVKPTDHYFKSGAVIVRFNDITEIDVYLNTGSDIHSAKEVVSDNVQ